MRAFFVVCVFICAASAEAQSRLWIWFDDDGTPNISDRRDSPDAEPFTIGTFEEVALRQQNTPHSGLGPTTRFRDAPSVADDVLALVKAASAKHKVPLPLLLAVVGIESGFRKNAVSRVGAQGLMQLMPATAEDLGVDAADPAANVDGGAKYLAWLLRYFGDERLALAGYNAGPGRVVRAGRRVPDIKETRAYVDNVRALRDAFARTGAR